MDTVKSLKLYLVYQKILLMSWSLIPRTMKIYWFLGIIQWACILNFRTARSNKLSSEPLKTGLPLLLFTSKIRVVIMRWLQVSKMMFLFCLSLYTFKNTIKSLAYFQKTTQIHHKIITATTTIMITVGLNMGKPSWTTSSSQKTKEIMMKVASQSISSFEGNMHNNLGTTLS